MTGIDLASVGGLAANVIAALARFAPELEAAAPEIAAVAA